MEFDELEIVANRKGVDVATCLTIKPILLFLGLRYWGIEEGGILVGDYDVRGGKVLTIFEDYLVFTNVAENPSVEFEISFEGFKAIAKLVNSGRAVSFYHVHPRDSYLISLDDVEAREKFSEALRYVGVEDVGVFERTPWFVISDEYVVSYLDRPHVVVYDAKLKWTVRSKHLYEVARKQYWNLVSDAELEGDELVNEVKKTHVTVTEKSKLSELVRNDLKDVVRILRGD